MFLLLPVLKGDMEVCDYAFQFRISIIAPESELSSLDILIGTRRHLGIRVTVSVQPLTLLEYQ